MKRFVSIALPVLLSALCIVMFFKLTALQNRVEQLENAGAAVPAMTQQQAEASEYEPEIEENDSFEGDSVDMEALRREYSHPEQVRRYFDEKYPELWMDASFSYGMSTELFLADGASVMQRSEFDAVGRSCIANALTWLLSDDMEIYTLLGFRSLNGEGDPTWGLNCIATDKGYKIIDPVLGLRGDETSRYGAMLPEAEVESLDEYVELILEDEAIRENLDSLWLFEGGEEISRRQGRAGFAAVDEGQGRLLYINEAKLEAEKALCAHIIPENIGNYRLASLLGGVTLSADEARALVDAEPETVRDKVKTAADVLMYMLAAQTADCGGCYCDEWGGYIWHTNLTAKAVMESRLGNCGSCANLANYLLDGDYEETGFINHAYYPGNGGGHVYNYILYQGEYYIVDYSSYIFSDYQDSDILSLPSLSDYNGDRAEELYGDVSLIIAYQSPGQHLPNIFGEDFGDMHYYVPQGAEYSVLYEAGDGYLIAEMPLDPNCHDYTKYWS